MLVAVYISYFALVVAALAFTVQRSSVGGLIFLVLLLLLGIAAKVTESRATRRRRAEDE